MPNRTLLAIGTKKGLWLATSDDDRRTWTVNPPQYPMTGVYGVAIDTRRPLPPAAGRCEQRAFRPVRRGQRRPGGHLVRTGRAADRLPRGHRHGTRSRLAAHPRTGRPARRGLRRRGTVRALPVRRRRPDLPTGTRAVGPRAPAALEGRLRRPGHPHRAAASDRTRTGHRRHVHRRRVPDGGQREVLAAGQSRDQRPVPARSAAGGSASAYTRSRRAPAIRTICISRTTAGFTAVPTTARAGSPLRTVCPAISASRWRLIRTGRT